MENGKATMQGWDEYEAHFFREAGARAVPNGLAGGSYAPMPWRSCLPAPIMINSDAGAQDPRPIWPPAQPTLAGPAARPPLSIDRYTDLLQLLTGGCEPATGIWKIKHLSDLERSAVRVEDLRAVLAVNGMAGAKGPKQLLLDQMQGLTLASPMCHEVVAPEVIRGDLDTAKAVLQEGLLRAVKWSAPTHINKISAVLARDGFYSYYPLQNISPTGRELHHKQDNNVSVSFTRGEDTGRYAASAPAVVPLDSTGTTEASMPDRNLDIIINSDDDAEAMELQQAQSPETDSLSALVSPPTWLVESVRRLSATSQASTADLNGAEILGWKVGIVLLEPFVHDGGGADPVVDTLEEGIHTGQVVEWIGMQHEQGDCPPDCAEDHNYCFVRIPPSRTTDPSSRSHRRRLDVAADLQDAFRADRLEDLLSLPGKALSTAWLLLEPREDDESV